MARAEIQRTPAVTVLGWRGDYVALDVQMMPLAPEEDGPALEMQVSLFSPALRSRVLPATFPLTPNAPAGCIVSGQLLPDALGTLKFSAMFFHNNRFCGVRDLEVARPPADRLPRAPSAPALYTGRATTAGE